MHYRRPANSLLIGGLLLLALGVFSLYAQERITRGAPASRPIEGVEVRELNNELLRIHGEMQQIAPEQWTTLQEEAAPVIEQRFAALSEMIQWNPGEALKYAFSPELADDLAAKFPQSLSHIERNGTWQGPVERWVFDGADRKSSREVLQMKVGQQTFEVHFAGPEPAGLKTGDVLEVTGVQVGNLLAASAGEVPNTVTTTASHRNQLESVDRRFSAMATTSTSTPSACTNIGVQNTAVLLVNFPGLTPPASVTAQTMNSLFFATTGQSLDDYWQEASYGQTSAAGDVYGWYTLNGSYSCANITQFISDAMSAAAASGVDFNAYSRVFIVYPDMTPSCGFAGLSTIGCGSVSTGSGTFNVSQSVLVWNDMTTVSQALPIVAHEGGHQLGLAHARLRDFTDSTGNLMPLGPLGTTGTLYEYGDRFSVMGVSDPGHYAAGHKAEQLGWLANGTDYQVIQSSGTYTIQPYEISPAGLNALKIQRGTGNDAWLWLEYRQPIGNYDSAFYPTQLFSGALIHYEDSITSPQTDLLDFTAPGAYNNNPALAVGQSWTDPYTNLSLSVLSATATGLTVSVNYGAVPCTHANPVVSASPVNPSVGPGASANYAVSVTNNDSSGCPSSTFNLGSSQPSGWSAALSAPSLALSPGQVGSATMSVGPPSGTLPGTYAVGASAANATTTSFVGSASANATVLSPALSVSLVASGSTVTVNQKVSFTARVLSGAAAAAGARVTFKVTKANGSTVTQTATANSAGTATWSYKIGQKDPKGVWSAGAQAAFNAQMASSNTVNFTVQ